MDKEEIDATLANAERKVMLGLATKPAVSWLFTLSLAWFMWWGQAAAAIPLFGGLCAVLSSSVTRKFLSSVRVFKNRRAAVLWTKLRSQPALNHDLSLTSIELSGQIGNFYEQDLRGEFFPLPQAVRLLDTHHRQQQRARLVGHRLTELDNLHFSLKQKMRQLRELGGAVEDGSPNLARIEADSQALKLLQDQIEASCRRLEMILISVQTGFKTRQLQREIAELGSRATSSNALDIASPENELSDIERQIGREIETFLELERETERHFG